MGCKHRARLLAMTRKSVPHWLQSAPSARFSTCAVCWRAIAAIWPTRDSGRPLDYLNPHLIDPTSVSGLSSPQPCPLSAWIKPPFSRRWAGSKPFSRHSTAKTMANSLLYLLGTPLTSSMSCALNSVNTSSPAIIFSAVANFCEIGIELDEDVNRTPICRSIPSGAKMRPDNGL